MDILDRKKVLSMIKRVGTNSKKLNELIHETAMQCMLHAQQHRDCTLMDRLVKSLHKGTRKKALVLWAEAHSPIRWNGDDKVGILNEKAKTFTPFKIDEANQTPFYDFTEENAPKQLTLDQLVKMVEGLPKRIEKAVNEDRFDGDADQAKLWAQKLVSVARVGDKPVALTH